MIDAPRYEIFTHSFSFSLRQTHKREICCQQTNRQNFATFSQLTGLRRLVFFTYPCLSLLKPMSMSPRWQCRLSCGFARDNLSQRFGRDIGALWRLQQEIHVIGQEEVYFWVYLAHINMYYMSCSCHPQIISSKIMYLRIITF